MTGRQTELQAFIEATELAVQARAGDYPDAMDMAERLFDSLKRVGASDQKPSPSRRAVCSYIAPALDIARTADAPLPGLANAIAAIEPDLAWERRPPSQNEPADFADKHANAIIVGDGGLEWSDTVRIGVSLVAPDTHYPRHRHPPEELYVVLSPGAWMQNDKPLQYHRSGDLVHNTPNIWHAMHATDVPLLAIWCLWTGE